MIKSFSVGSGGSTGADKTIIVDLDGAVKQLKLVKKRVSNITLWYQRTILDVKHLMRVEI